MMTSIKMSSVNEPCGGRGGSGVDPYSFTLAGLFELKLRWQAEQPFSPVDPLFKDQFQPIFFHLPFVRKKSNFYYSTETQVNSQALSFGALIETTWLQIHRSEAGPLCSVTFSPPNEQC